MTAVPDLRNRVRSLKRLCVEAVLAHPQLSCAAALPLDIRDELARRLFFGACLLGTAPVAAAGVAVVLRPLWRRSPAEEDAEWGARLAYAKVSAEGEG